MSTSDTLPSPQERIADTQRGYDAKLRDERRALVVQHRLLNLQTSYIARLPDEVLLEIFERYYETTKHGVQYWEFHERYDTFALDPFCVIRLTHVCSRLRELAFRTIEHFPSHGLQI